MIFKTSSLRDAPRKKSIISDSYKKPGLTTLSKKLKKPVGNCGEPSLTRLPSSK
jgi:hypothetical protein